MKGIIASVLATWLLYALSTCPVSGQQCITSGDCYHGDCCISFNRPIGRRRRQIDSLTCQPRGLLHEECLVRDLTFDLTHTYFVCPCANGLVCIGIGEYDIPLGEIGTCEIPGILV